ncbi:hypothetical protein JCM11251_002410 [Rhodosporidiobolus azoricus]
MPPRHLLATLLTTRRGVVLLALFIGLVYLLFRPSASTVSPVSTTPPKEGYAAYVPQKLKEGWSSWRSGGLSDSAGDVLAGHAAGGVRAGSQAALVEEELRKKEKEKVVWHLAPAGESPAPDEEAEEERGEDSSASTADDDMFLSAEKAGLVQQEKEDARVDSVAAAERRPGAAGGKGRRPDGLLSPDELDSLDAAAEEERLASSNSHSSHRGGSANSPDDSSSSSSPDPLSPDSDISLPHASSSDFDEESYDDLEEIEGGDASSDFSPEEAAEADAPSIAAKEDARLRAPMAALSKGKPLEDGAGEEDEADEGVREEGEKVKPVTVHKGKGAGAAAPPPAAVAPERPAGRPALNGGKKVGTGGKLAKGDAAAVPPARGQGAAGRGKAAGGVVKAEAGRRVGTGARPGAKGMGMEGGRRMRVKVKRGRKLEEDQA